MITVGIDLASQDSDTALARVEWDERSGARVTALAVDVSDDDILDAVRDSAVTKIGVDCPLGWPAEFVRLVTEHRTQTIDAATHDGWRRRAVYRTTDLAVEDEPLQRRPLSASTDKLAYATIRCALLLSKLDHEVDRTGRGRIVEVYPAGSMRAWGIPFAKYKEKENRPALGTLVDALASGPLCLTFADGCGKLCRDNDDAFDAVVCAVTARAAHLDLLAHDLDELPEEAATEGWIALPRAGSLDLLVSG